jgi:integrase
MTPAAKGRAVPWTEQLPTGLHRACWRDASGRKRSKSGFVQRAQAARYAGEQETKTRRGEAGYTGRSITWGAWAPTWLDLRQVEGTTQSSDATRLARWVEPRWGKVPLARISTEDVQGWVNELGTQMGPASVAKVYRLLSSSLKAAVRYRRLAVSPCIDIDLPSPPPGGERFLTRGEVDAAVYYMAGPYRAAAILLVGTGMRFGEMAGLHWSRIDFMAGSIDVVETWTGTEIKPYPKGGSRSYRRVPLPSWVADALPEAETRKTCGLPHRRGSRCRSGLVLTGPRGAPLDHRNMLRRHWLPALERAGIDRARQHDLRHSYASWLAQDGVSMTVIAALLGHSETTVTARYSHLAGTHMESVRTVLESLRAPSAPHVLDKSAE